MKRLKIVAVTVAWAVTIVAVGMTATSWASNRSAAPPAGAVPHAGPHTVFPPSRLEAVYDAITPCRIVDTTHGGGSLSNGVSRSFFVGGTTGFAPQGGKSGGCGIPVGATAVSAIVTAVNTVAHGYLRAYPSGSPEPNATILSYAQGGSTGTGATISIDKTTANSLRVTNHGGPAGLIIDVTGFYAPQIEAHILSNGALFAGSSRIVSASRDSTGAYTLTIDSDVEYCAPTVTPYLGDVYGTAYTQNGVHVHVFLWTLDPTTHASVATDSNFWITVEC